MVIVLITAWLAVLAVCALYYRQPWRARGRVGVLWLFATYRPGHAAPAAEPAQAIADWAGSIVGVDVCAQCAAPMQGGACPRCGWERPPDRAPWPRLTDDDRAALAAGLDAAREIAAEPRPGAVLMPAPTQDVSGSGRPAEPTAGAWLPAYADLAPPVPPAPPQPPPGAGKVHPPEPPAAEPRLMWHGDVKAAEPPPPEPELPPSGDWAPGTGPPQDDEPEPERPLEPEPQHWAPHGYARGAMRWAPPTRKATPAESALARELASQDADAAEFIDAMHWAARRYLWQIRRGFLVQQGLARAQV